jgi:thymidylate synthase (FAD)
LRDLTLTGGDVNVNKRIQVLDHGYVELIETWGADERIIEAARMSTGKGFEGWEKDAKLLGFLYRNKHMTPFEMAGAIIEVQAPIFVFREWHRHRTQSYNEMSARYIPLPDVNYLPDLRDVAARSQKAFDSKNKQARSASDRVASEGDAFRWCSLLAEYYTHGQKLYEDGLALGIPKELARLPVTVGRYSRMRASANLRNWLQFLELRMALGAQQEIRFYANAVCEILEEYFPRTLDLFKEGKS